MKKALLPLVIASLLPAAAFADVTVYGKGNVSFQNADEADQSELQLVSNASRIGIKGSDEISSGLKAIYQFEYQTEIDDGTNGSQTFGQRNIYIGLQGSAGTIMGGNFDTPTKSAQEKIDLFNDLEGDMAYLVKGDIRAKNIVQYVTPAMGGFALNVAVVAAEAGENADDGVSASISYTTSALYLALASETDVAAQGRDVTRLVGRYTVGAFQLGGLYEQSSLADVDSDAWLVSAKFNATDKFALKAQFGDATDDMGAFDDTKNQLSVGFDYTLSKNTTLFAYYTDESAEEDSDETADDNWIGVGLDLKF
jgi:predicted porin